MFINYKPCKSGDENFSNGHMNSRWPLDQRVLFEKLLDYAGTLPNLVLTHLFRWGYVFYLYFICHKTAQDQSIEMPCMSMGESSFQHVTTQQSLVSIDILIVKSKNGSSKTSILYVRTASEKIELIE